MFRRPPSPTLFPSTPLFRSRPLTAVAGHLGSHTRHGQTGARGQSELFEGLLGEASRLDLLESELGMASNLLAQPDDLLAALIDRKSTRLNSSHLVISYAVFC